MEARATHLPKGFSRVDKLMDRGNSDDCDEFNVLRIMHGSCILCESGKDILNWRGDQDH